MPSTLHEALVLLFRESPRLVPMLVAQAHGHEPGSQAIGAAALAACHPLVNPRSSLYADLIFSNLNEIARAALEDVMDLNNYTYQSDFAKKYVAEGYRELLRKQLQQRFGALPADVIATLEQAGTDALDKWASRVLTATSLADVFASDPA